MSRSRSKSNKPYSFKYTDTHLGNHDTRTIHLKFYNNESRKKEDIGHFTIAEKIVDENRINHRETRNQNVSIVVILVL